MSSSPTSFSLGLAAVLALAGCEGSMEPSQVPPQGGYPPGQYAPPGQYPPGQYAPPGQYPPGQYAPPGYPQGYAPPGYPQGYAPPGYPQGYAPQGQLAPPQAYPAPADPINTMDIAYLRGTARSVLGELVAALPPASQAKVQGIPFATDAKVGEVNAYAACDASHMPLMAVTDGLLQIEAYIAQLRATDEVFGTQKLEVYLQALARDQKPGQPIVAPPAGLVDPAQHADGRKVARQHQIFEEQLAFVLGHELGHHHLGHTGCANGQSGERGVTVADLARLATRVVPVMNQPNEMAADMVGVDDLLAAGARRQGYHWTEQGALLTLAFFSRLDKLTAEKLFLSFADSHPNPALRVGPVQQEAARFRTSGGVWWQPLLPMP